jgi:hypothetical protein
MTQRGAVLTYKTVRQWCLQFGQTFANDLRRRRPRTGDKWHPDEVFIRINGETHLADNFLGDDLHHNGDFCLQDAFIFASFFGKPRTGPATQPPTFFDFGTPDGYQFFLYTGRKSPEQPPYA